MVYDFVDAICSHYCIVVFTSGIYGGKTTFPIMLYKKSQALLPGNTQSYEALQSN